MKKSIKAALYSTLIFPGAGLWWLKRYGLAASFILPALAISAYVLRATMATAYLLSDQIVEGSLPLEVMALTRAVLQSAQQLTLNLSGVIWLFILCWGLSVAVSYLAGDQLDKANR
ncbi:MAG: hypothetical protein Q8R10_04645 [Pseudomonas sp.]|uniref:hypothetical protein n=1 Tax=Pseudomonas sp. TaxID=306 RepID=UPI0027352D1F|nr:hypothetical protein [Pseudomonas sp.]MDP3845696.1 hypothetical protein [Pseudomonas sp.]